MTYRRTTNLDEANKEIDHLRSVIVCFVKEPFRGLIQHYDPLESVAAFYDWQRATIEAVIEKTAPSSYDERVHCPLCGSAGRDGHGYSLPGGLEMHLTGHGAAWRCDIIEIAFNIVMERNAERFEQHEQAALAYLKHRQQTERVFLINPAKEPELALPEHYDPRPADEWPAAETALREMGFTIDIAGNVTTYKLMHGDDWMILADPRYRGKFEFHIFKRSGKAWRRPNSATVFSLRGATNWATRFRDRLQEHIAALESKKKTGNQRRPA